MRRIAVAMLLIGASCLTNENTNGVSAVRLKQTIKADVYDEDDDQSEDTLVSQPDNQSLQLS